VVGGTGRDRPLFLTIDGVGRRKSWGRSQHFRGAQASSGDAPVCLTADRVGIATSRIRRFGTSCRPSRCVPFATRTLWTVLGMANRPFPATCRAATRRSPATCEQALRVLARLENESFIRMNHPPLCASTQFPFGLAHSRKSPDRRCRLGYRTGHRRRARRLGTRGGGLRIDNNLHPRSECRFDRLGVLSRQGVLGGKASAGPRDSGVGRVEVGDLGCKLLAQHRRCLGVEHRYSRPRLARLAPAGCRNRGHGRDRRVSVCLS
jgi:hypothetical protein